MAPKKDYVEAPNKQGVKELKYVIIFFQLEKKCPSQ